MRANSISFIILVLLLGLLIGAVTGSLVSRIFGLEFINRPLFSTPLHVAENFYIIKNLELQPTPASLLGFVIAVWLLYRNKERR